MTKTKKELKFENDLQIANILKAKEFNNKSDLNLEILTSGIHPKAIIILSFLVALNAKRMRFNKIELANKLKFSQYSAWRYSKELISLGLLKVEVIPTSKGREAYYSVYDFKIKNEDKTLSSVLNDIKNYTYMPPKIDIVQLTPDTSEFEGNMKLYEPLETPKIDCYADLSKKDMKHFEEVKEIIDYLNLKANKKFRYNNKSSNKFITARLKDGYTIEDLKAVVDLKCKDWLYNDKMNEYLRPETLFNASKFESYIQLANSNSKKQEALESYDMDTMQKMVEGFEKTFKNQIFTIEGVTCEFFNAEIKENSIYIKLNRKLNIFYYYIVKESLENFKDFETYKEYVYMIHKNRDYFTGKIYKEEKL